VDRRLRELLEIERAAGGARGSASARGKGGVAPVFSHGAAGGNSPAVAQDPLSTVRSVFGFVWAAMLAFCAYVIYARFRRRKTKPWEAAR
jgi:hypothetical protein